MKKFLISAAALAVVAMLLGGTSGAGDAQAGAPRPVGNEEIIVWPTGDLLVHLPDPPVGKEYQGPDQMVIPDGYCWKVKSIVFHLTTAPAIPGSTVRRNVKLVLRDVNDTGDSNQGRYFVVLALGLQNYVYIDFAASVGQNQFPGVMGPGVGAGNLLKTHVNAGLPNICFPPGYAWATVSDYRTAADQYTEFFAVVEQVPLP